MKGFCVNCMFLEDAGPTSIHKLCRYSENKKVINYVSGETGYQHGARYPFAYERNGAGQCEDFERALEGTRS